MPDPAIGSTIGEPLLPALVVWYIHKDTTGGVTQSANIMWKGKWPMQAGTYPVDHPCEVSASGFQKFKERGYWANPFPEGDGITVDVKEKSSEQVVKDIEECMGWEVRKGRPPLH